MSIILEKISNGLILVTGDSYEYTFQPTARIVKNANGVSILDNDTHLRNYAAVDVERVISSDGGDVEINGDVDLLFNQLITYFFFLNLGSETNVDDAQIQISYFTTVDISTQSSGTISFPTNSTLNETALGAYDNSVVLQLDTSGFIIQEIVTDTNGNAIDSTLDSFGNWVVNGNVPDLVALSYMVSIKLSDYANWTTELSNIIDMSASSDLVEVRKDLEDHIDNTDNPHSTDIGNIGSGTLAELNAKITDATLDDSSDSRPLVDSGVTAGSYTLSNITVDSKGRVTVASSGSATQSPPYLNQTLVLTCTNSIDINTIAGNTIPFSVPLRSTIPGIALVNGILTLGTSGQYRMSYKIISDSNNALRKNPHTVIQKNSLADLPLTLSTTYERNTNDATGTNAIPMTDDIINMNLIGGETFNVRGYQGGSGGGAITLPASCIWTIEKIA